MTRQEAQATPDVVTGTLSIFGDDARVLIDPGATHSFISREYVAQVGMTPVPLGCGLEIATPSLYGLVRCFRVACFLLRAKLWK